MFPSTAFAMNHQSGSDVIHSVAGNRQSENNSDYRLSGRGDKNYCLQIDNNVLYV
jgi:hypothetical protein